MAFTKITAAGIDTSGTVTTQSISVSGVSTVGSLSIGATSIISAGRQLQNIASLDATTTATIESAVANAPNTFTNLNITGISTLGVTSATNLTAQSLNVSGIITATQLSTGASGTGVNISTDTISGPATLTIDPAAVGDNTGAVRIKGDLYVDGTQFIVNSTTIELADFNVGIASTVGTNALLDGAGIGIGSTGIRKTITWSNSSTALKSSEDFDISSGKVYKIGGTSVLSNNTLGSGVVTSSLTSVGTLTNLNVGNINSTGIITATTFVGALTGTATSTTNIPNLTGAITSNNTTTSLGSFSSANLATALTDETGSGSAVFATSPTLVTPVLGAATATSLVVSSGSTFTNGPVLIGTGTSTGTASQPLQVTGGAYVSGNLGVGINNPTARMHLVLSGDTPNPVLQVTRANNSGGGVGNDEVGIAVTIPNTYNSAGTVYGVRSYVNHNLGGQHYAGHFVAAGSAYSNGIGVYAKTTHTDTNGPGFQPAILADAYSNIGASNSGYAVALQGQTNNYVNNVNLVLTSNYTGSLAQTLVRFERNGSYIGFITCSTTAVSYQTSSSSGLFAPDANTITLNTNSTQRLLVDSSGNLLINSTTATGTASQPLQVTGGAYVSGNLGVGINNPTEKTTINGNILLDYGITSSAYSEIRARYIGQNNCQSAIRFYNPNNSYDGALTIWTQPNTASASMVERMRIDGAGNIKTNWLDGSFFGTYYDATYYQGFTFGATARTLYIDNRANDTRADIVFRNSATGTVTEKMRIDSVGAIIKNQATKEYNYSGFVANNAAITIDVPVVDDTSTGCGHKIWANHTHYNWSSYGAMIECWISSRGATILEQLNTHNVTSANGGAWTVTKPTTTTLRISKSAGTYSGTGYYWVRVVTNY